MTRQPEVSQTRANASSIRAADKRSTGPLLVAIRTQQAREPEANQVAIHRFSWPRWRTFVLACFRLSVCLSVRVSVCPCVRLLGSPTTTLMIIIN